MHIENKQKNIKNKRMHPENTKKFKKYQSDLLNKGLIK